MSDTQLTYTAGPEDQDTFLRDILYTRLLLSHSLVVRLKHQHKIKVNGCTARTNCPIHPGDFISIDLDFTEESKIIPEYIPLDIVYEDEDFLVVNKPAGISTHPSRKGGTGTLANAVTYYWQSLGKTSLFRPINRLDRDTSGLILIGKSHFAHQGLFNQKKCRILERRYIALVEGAMAKDKDCIDQPIARPDDKLRKRIVDPDGYPAVTHYQVLEKYPEHTLLSLRLETGRTHQIRVHLSFLGHPICGDLLYGSVSPLIARQALHADRLRFIHPRSGKEIILEIPMAKDMEKAVHHLTKLELHQHVYHLIKT
ncbi:MAG: RluA family pseudouridine synthase [Dehalobacterium sp.]